MVLYILHLFVYIVNTEQYNKYKVHKYLRIPVLIPIHYIIGTYYKHLRLYYQMYYIDSTWSLMFRSRDITFINIFYNIHQCQMLNTY